MGLIPRAKAKTKTLQTQSECYTYKYMTFSNSRPWSLSTTVLASVVFTPIIGGILAALNERHLGHPEKQRKYYQLCFITFLWYSIYNSYFLSYTWIPLGPLAFPFVNFPSAVVASLVSSPASTILFLVFPSLIIIYRIFTLQRQSWHEDKVKQISLRPWWTAYLFGVVLTPIIGFATTIIYLLFVSSGIFSIPDMIRSAVGL